MLQFQVAIGHKVGGGGSKYTDGVNSQTKKIFLLRGARGKLYGLSHWHTDDTISSSDAAAGQFLISLVDTLSILLF